jgi:hypothetical protein
MEQSETTHFVINVSGAALPKHAVEAIAEALRTTTSERLAKVNLGPGHRIASVKVDPVTSPLGANGEVVLGWRIVLGGDFGVTIERT